MNKQYILILCIAIGCVGCNNTHAFQSRREAVNAMRQYRESEGTVQEEYEATEYKNTSIYNPAYDRAIEKRELRAHEEHIDAVKACNGLVVGRKWTLAIRNSRSSLPWNWAKHLKAGRQITPELIRECIKLADANKKMQLDRATSEIGLPPKLIKDREEVVVTKTRDVEKVDCIEEAESRQWICWDKKTNENYHYFRW